jgi:hypothetical protein
MGVSPHPFQDIYRSDSRGRLSHILGGAEILGFISAFPQGPGFFSPPEVAFGSIFRFLESTRRRLESAFGIAFRRSLLPLSATGLLNQGFQSTAFSRSYLADRLFRVPSSLRGLGASRDSSPRYSSSLFLSVHRWRQDSSRALPLHYGVPSIARGF